METVIRIILSLAVSLTLTGLGYYLWNTVVIQYGLPAIQSYAHAICIRAIIECFFFKHDLKD